MTEAGTHIGSEGSAHRPPPTPPTTRVPRPRGAPRAAPRVLPRGLHGRDPPGSRVGPRRRAERPCGLWRRRGRGRPRLGLVRRHGDRRAGRGARARRGRRARSRRRHRRGLRAAPVGRALRPLPRGRRAPAPAGAAAAPGDRAPARAPARPRRAERRVALDAYDGWARLHRHARRRVPSQPSHAGGGEGDAASALASLAPRWLAAPVGDRPSLRRGVRGDRRTRRVRRAEGRRRVPAPDSRRAQPCHRARAPPRRTRRRARARSPRRPNGA